MPIIDLRNLRIARTELDELANWIHNIPAPVSGSWDLHSIELAIALIDEEIKRFERRKEIA